MRSERIASEIMSELHEEVKDFLSRVISHHRTISFGEIEDSVTELSATFGKRLSEGALYSVGNGYIGRTIDCNCGGTMEYHSDRRWKLTSLNGNLELHRAYYYCETCKSSRTPLDEQLRLEGKHQSIGVREKMASVAESEPFALAVERLQELTGVCVSAKETQLESEELGREVGLQSDAEVEGLWREGRRPEDIEKDIENMEPEETVVAPRRLYITADGTIVPTDEGGKEAKVGSVYETSLSKDALANDIRYTGGFHKAKHFGRKLYILAAKRGLRNAHEIVFIGDGAPWIWNLAKYHFPEAIHIVDWYHAEKHLWDVGHSVFGEGTQIASEWVKKKLDMLMEGNVEAVIASLSELSSTISDVKEKIQANITYFTNNEERMRYNEYIAKGYHIGSGTVESACKHVVGQRLKQAGMKWSLAGADAILQLRILRKNGEWRRFWSDRRLAA
jgi:hypothetical protein